MADAIKRKGALYFFLVLVAAVLIAAALPQFELEPGIPLPNQTSTAGEAAILENPLVAISINTLMRTILAVILVLIVLYGAYSLIRGTPWKEIAGPILRIVAIAVIFLAVIFALVNVRIDAGPSGPEILPPAVEHLGPPLSPPPANLIWLIWAGLGVMAALFVAWFLWGRRSQKPPDPFLLEAEWALRAIQSGQNLGDVIIHCYLNMSLILQQNQEIVREEAMTAREFERLLGERGVPPAPVYQLTRLFEAARYSARLSGPEDEKRAIESLNAIVQYCREKVPVLPQ
ncbi:MAG TPA: DUF4129 domain-containing protein [Anaerolineaceae bacterium]|nr:DUF4129 domain-containing protein [Anaerolineaceae bacterium]